MAWARVDDGWWCHPKVMGRSLAARGLWVSALSWSCAHRVEVVPHDFIHMVGGSKDEASELVEAGLWVETEGGYRFHDWAVYQDLSLSEKRADAGRKGGIKSGESRREAKQTEATDEAGTQPIPSQPNPTPEKTPARREPRGAMGFDLFWELYPRKIGKRQAEKAWDAAAKRAGPSPIVDGLRRLLPSLSVKDPKFIPHPSTWLNRDGWLDEPDPDPLSLPPAASPRTQRNAAAREQVMAAIRGGS